MILWLVALALAQPEPPAPCEALFASGESGREAPSCVYQHARRTGAYDEAIAWMEPVLAESPDWSFARLTLASLYMDQGKTERAVPEMQRAAEDFAAQGIANGEVFARLNLCQMAARRNDLDEVRHQLDAALAVAADDPQLAAVVKSQRLRTAYQQQLDLDLTLLRATELTEELGEDGNLQARKIALHVATEVAALLHRTDEWLTHHRALRAFLAETGDIYALANTRAAALEHVRTRPALAQRLLGERSLREEALEVAALARDAQNPWVEVSMRFLAALHARDAEEEAAQLAQARTVGGGLGEPVFLWHLEANRAVQLAALGRAEEALATAAALPAEELPLQTAITVAKTRFHAHHLLGNIAERDAAAERFLEGATLHLETRPEAQRAVRDDWDAEFHDVAWVLAEEGRLDEALAVLETTRGHAVRRALQEQALIPDTALRARFTAASAALDQAEQDLAYATDADVAQLLERAHEARAELSNLLDTLETEAPALAALRRTEAPSLEALQARLAPGEVIVSFQWPTERSLAPAWRWVIRHDGSQLDELDLEGIEVQLDIFTGDGGENPHAAATLHERLLGDVLDGSDTRVVLLPEGALHALPFAALRSGAQAPPLGEQAVLSQVSSLTLWSRWQDTVPAHEGLRTLADPAFDAELAAARLPRTPERLAWAAAEAHALAKLGAEVLTDAQATEQAAFAGPVGLLHLAAHAVVPPHAPSTAGLLLAPDGEEDGWLSVGEILPHRLDGAVVVLSACRSAGGDAVGAQGPEGLAQAFQQAGASAVISTLWPLRDDHAEAIFSTFYGHIGAGVSLGEALRQTRRQLRAEGWPAEAWAAVTLTGNPDVQLFEEAPRRGWMAWLLALLALIASSTAWRWTRRAASP